MSDTTTLIGPFRLERQLALGHASEVWLGVHTPQEMPVAVKLLTGKSLSDARSRSAFRNEARAAAMLDHPNIIRVIDYGTITLGMARASGDQLVEDTPFLVTELASGGSLRSYVEQPRTWEEIRSALLSVLDALAHAHARGVIHRDLRVENVLICDENDLRPGLKLADFGLAHAAAEEAPAPARMTVQPHHLAPEQLLGKWRDQGPWTDLYSLGSMAWELTTGEPLFAELEGRDLARAHLGRKPPPFKPRMDLPEGFTRWLASLLMKSPYRRTRHASDAANALRALERGAAPVEQPEEVPKPPAFYALNAAPDGRGEIARVPADWRMEEQLATPLPLEGAGLGLYWLRGRVLVGREAERDHLWAVLRRVARHGQARAVVLRGPAGAGRTHLVEWLAERASELGAANVLKVVCSPRSEPRDPLRRMLAHTLRTNRLAREEVAERVESWLKSRQQVDPYEVDALTEVIVPSLRQERVGGLHTVRFSTTEEPHAVMRRFVEQMAADRPALLWLEDVHWSAYTLDFAMHLLRAQSMSPSRVLVVLTAREESLAERPEEAERLKALLSMQNADSLHIGALSPEDHLRMVERLLSLERPLARTVADRTGGNPLFAVQLVGEWVMRGLLEAGPLGFRLVEDAEAVIPDDLHEVWSGRVERLLTSFHEDARVALEQAAVLGLEVDDDEWREVADDPESFHREGETSGHFGFRPEGVRLRMELVEALLEARLAVETDMGWSFVHPMLRESVERDARKRGRLRGHHRAVAMVLLRRLRAGQQGVAERLARHLVSAGALEEGIEPLIHAGEERMESTGIQEARSLLVSARQVMRLIDLPEDDFRWPLLYKVWAKLELFQGHIDSAADWAQRALRGARKIRAEDLPEVLEVVADAKIEQGNLELAGVLLREALELYRDQGDDLGVARCLSGLAGAEPERAYAEQLLHEAEELQRKQGDAIGLTDTVLFLADLSFRVRNWKKAGRQYGRAYELARASGYRPGQARAASGKADAARRMGDLLTAEEGYTEAFRLYEATGSDMAVLPRLRLAMVRLEQERFARAREVLEPVLADLGQHPRRNLLTLVYALLVPCSLAEGDADAFGAAVDMLTDLLSDRGEVDGDVICALEQAQQLTKGAARQQVDALVALVEGAS
ncbi:MAG: protein kinase [Deltaproteobacteria bacterium]|nr:protein kinase [Deltaproteobacteria bacterium]